MAAITIPEALSPLLGDPGRRTQFDGERLSKAYALAERAYAGKSHWTGIPLLEHSLGVLEILRPFEPDQDTVIACLLQHLLEVKHMTLTELADQFGPKVRSLVSGIHLLSHVSMRHREHAVEDLRLMLLSVSDDVRVILTILCDRCFVLEHLHAVPLRERKRVARDVLNLFAPVAARLGIQSLKQRMEGIAFPIVYPSDAQGIYEQMQGLKFRFGEFLPVAAEKLKTSLHEEGIEALVQGREKHSHSIFMKMKAKGLSSIDRLPDLFALRVVVSSQEECYRVLGVLHRLGHPLANRFKDFIAFPKPNGYQSLHTTMARFPGVPEGVLIEIQMRTGDMHREAEYGVAAHWSYKQGGTTQHMMERVSLHQMLTAQYAVESPEEEGSSSALADHIFVLTPKGDIVELPEGATPLDFAFQIHTDLGLGFRAARVNGSIVPLDHELENGDLVEIQTHHIPKPSPQWLNQLKMASSRSRLKRYLYALNREEYVNLGRNLLNDEFVKHRLPPLDADLSYLRFYEDEELSMAEREDVLMKVGQGAEKASSVLLHLKIPRTLLSSTPVKKAAPRMRLQRKDSLIEIDGGLPMPLRFAKCCKPSEGNREKIIGSVTRTGEVVIHRAKCHMVKNSNPERRIGVRWRGENS